MNGRIYDPTLGRFLQADPHIQAPMNSQSYNRYSYVLNNPLSYTDPSGYFFKQLNKIFGKFAPFASLLAMVFIPGAWAFATESLFGAVTTGFLAGGVSTGSLKGALVGAFSAAAFYGVGQHFKGLAAGNSDDAVTHSFGGLDLTSGQIAGQVASHASVGGVTSVLSGGKFGHGFFSAGVTKGIGGAFLPGGDNLTSNEIAKGTIVSAVIGGTASVISGGKFSNGARTGAFQYLFNQALSSIKKGYDRIETTKRIIDIANQYGDESFSDVVDAMNFIRRADLSTLRDMFPHLSSNDTQIQAEIYALTVSFRRDVSLPSGAKMGGVTFSAFVDLGLGSMSDRTLALAEVYMTAIGMGNNLSGSQIVDNYGKNIMWPQYYKGN
ncbi:RHS repeat-associated core domain-containing protein [Aliiglaciecola sp. LCG003]|uniref:RHS repeat-associated core domain-containing protein n=1 Tax=Aliiglaciecola sp. LCG003 TaxID=3053655 RepID=UPI002573ABEB|nr:RHS repeat-associated core domain-containing protein [Aliiglaciecola sp. LCG003]WJG07965.1 RHS repeat-associated core domain-containing protein [Aliiglaciecola sp. LCG003]